MLVTVKVVLSEMSIVNPTVMDGGGRVVLDVTCDSVVQGEGGSEFA